ncbi:hypothetical protein ORV05_17655 [Amycolatopsis cynarae]|uniref:Uncharacterized protein n=1 Tax=Amycolatopsis cynarae TaxID=2995223 RepID=A0ABY7BFZ5_9PSEU|nr:hypothetical protein [Amycolatopsis sp. HUAS 11-8]WAL69518.1 hypothetical protein ORV05_17655 [Amycolatopsis sp. HUAS 11-8]
MKLARVILLAAGLAGLAWGAVLLIQWAIPQPDQALVAAGWLIGGPVLHDAVIAPVCGLVGLAVARLAPRHWRAPLTIGLVVSAILALLAVPLLWRAFGAPSQPGLHDRNVLPGLLIALAVVWGLVVVAGVLRTVRSSRS